MDVQDIVKLAQKEGAHDAVATLYRNNTYQTKFANSAIAALQVWNTSALGLFVAVKNKTAFMNLQDISEQAIKAAVQRLVKIAKNSQPSEDYKGIASGPFEYNSSQYDKKIIENVEKQPEFVSQAIDATKLKKTAGILYSKQNEMVLATSNDVLATNRSASIEFSIRAFAAKDESGHGVSCARSLSDFNPVKAGEHAGDIARQASKPQPGEAGKYNVLFEPLAFADLINKVAHNASAFDVDAGYSFLIDKLGKQIASPNITLTDSGQSSLHSRAFDDEGVPVKENTIVENGVLKTYLHNTSTAKKYKTETTANAGLISPYPFCAMLKPGNQTKDQLLSQIKNGIYVTNIWYTRFQNYQTGDFSTIPRDGLFLVRNGSIVKSLKGLRITDNLQGLLERAVALGSKPEWILWWGMDYQTPAFTPHVLIKDVNFTKSLM